MRIRDVLCGALVVICAVESHGGSSASIHDQSKRLSFKNTQLGPGLLNRTVTSIICDRQGYMWFGTFDGVCRFDGFDCTVYRPDSLSPAQTGDYAVSSLAVDSLGRIWIGTKTHGLDVLDPLTGVITHYRHDPDRSGSISHDYVTSLLIDRTGALWIGAESRGFDVRGGPPVG